MNFSVSLADLVLLNLLFILFSLPLITIPAALTALYRIAYSFAKGEPLKDRRTDIISLETPAVAEKNPDLDRRKTDYEGLRKLFVFYKDTFAAEFKRSTPVGACLVFIAAICIYILFRVKPEGPGLLVCAFILVSLAAAIIGGSYFHTIIAVLDISASDAVRNSIILLFENLAQNVIAFLLFAILNIVVFVLLPFSFPFLICIHFSLSAYMIERRIYSGIEKCIAE